MFDIENLVEIYSESINFIANAMPDINYSWVRSVICGFYVIHIKIAIIPWKVLM